MTTSAVASIEDYREIDALMQSSLEHYCSKLVTIKPKTAAPHRFVWNEPQRRLHTYLERQREETGRIRAIILKARQMGISTYVGARFYHEVSFNIGRSCYILTHEDTATQNLFGMVKRIHDNMPLDFRPEDTSNNANQLKFGALDGGYAVGTAQGTKGTGRSFTFQLFHGSEVAFWRNAEEHFGGVMEAVPDQRGTEVILESTANGIGGVFYTEWTKATAGESDFIPVFLPWFTMPDYRRPVEEGVEWSAEEIEYKHVYKLDDEQLSWMRGKNASMPGGKPGTLCRLFRQEYPATADEAFQTSGEDVLIDGIAVQRARKNIINPEQVKYEPRVLGADIAMGGKDRTRFVDRQGRIAGRINRVLHTNDPKVIAEAIAVILRENPDIVMVFIDMSGGWGSGVHSFLVSWGFGDRVQGVNFGGEPTDPETAVNKRSSMYWDMSEWFKDPAGVDIPDEDICAQHLTASPYGFDHKRRLKMPPKEQIKKDYGFSPDWADALGLTFAEPVALAPEGERRPQWLIDHLAETDHHNWKTR